MPPVNENRFRAYLPHQTVQPLGSSAPDPNNNQKSQVYPEIVYMLERYPETIELLAFSRRSA